MDIDIRRALAALEASGRADRTIIMLVGDHGESLNDHGELLHGDAYFDSVTNVPLLIKVPGLKGNKASLGALVSQVDMLPTLLELVGAKDPAGIDGVSLLPILTGASEAVRSTTLIEGGVARQVANNVPSGGVITDKWALLRQNRGCGGPLQADPPRQAGEPATCLFDRSVASGEDKNVALQHLDVVAELQDRWDGFRATRATQAKQLDLDPAFVEELQRTGYDFRLGAP
jgi:arylsulfatase A-like enzyme